MKLKPALCAACLAGALSACAPTRAPPKVTPESTMNQSAQEPTPELHDVTLLVDGQQLLVTADEGRQMGQALNAYLQQHEKTPDGVALPRGAGQAWVDSQGALRLGTWRLAAPNGKPVLVWREPPQPGAAVGYQFIADLERAAGAWRVAGIQMVRTPYPRPGR